MIVAVCEVQLASVQADELAWAFEPGGETPGRQAGTLPGTAMRWRAANLTMRAADHSKRPAAPKAPALRRPVPDLGLSHLCIQCRTLASGLAVAQMGGFEAIEGPTDLGTGYQYLYAHGPSGMLVEMEGAAFAPADMPAFWIGHVAWAAGDGAALAGFYAALLGRPVSASRRLRDHVLFDRVTGLEQADLEGWWVPGLNIGLEFWQFHNPRPAGRWAGPGPSCVAFGSDDLDADSLRAVALGATPWTPAQDLQDETDGPVSGETRRFLDPEGNRFDLMPQGADWHGSLPDPELLQRLDRWHPARRQEAGAAGQTDG